MKFSELVKILDEANMVSDITISEEKDCEISDLNLMDQDYRSFSSNTVYFIDAVQIGPGTEIPECLLYSNEFPEYRAKDIVNAARITDASLAKVFRYVKTQLDSAPQAQEQYADIVSRLMSGVDLQLILTDAFSYTGNLFVAIDMSGKILANSTPFYVDYPLWMNSVQQGYCDEILMDYIESRRRTLNVPKGPAPFSLYCRKINMYILVARIIHENETFGYFFALNRKPAFDNHTKKLLPLFAQRVKESILRLKNVNSQHAIMQTNILMDALSGAPPAETSLRLKITGLKFKKYMRVIVIKSSYSRSPDFYAQVIYPAASEILQSNPCFPWKSAVVCLVGTDANGLLPEDIQKALNKFMEEHQLIAGVSNLFSNISRFAEYFEQARTALTFANRGNNTGPFFYYLDYSLYVIFDRVDDDRLLDQCCHPALDRLAAYDAKKGTDLFETLRTFTEAGFSKTRTAQLLFSHRNTINYRIQQIEQLCGIDLSDEKLLFPLQISFTLYAYRKSRLIDER